MKLILKHSGVCAVKDCNRYSDVDVYFADGRSPEMCTEHATHAIENNRIDRVVPRRGHVGINKERLKGAN